MSTASSIEDYLSELEPKRRTLLETLRNTSLENLKPGFEEVIDFGMITYVVPLARYPDTYNGKPLMYAAIASQKQYASLYLMGCYVDPDFDQQFRAEYLSATGRKPNMGKSCVRFRKVEDVPVELIGRTTGLHTVESFIEHHERSRASS